MVYAIIDIYQVLTHKTAKTIDANEKTFLKLLLRCYQITESFSLGEAYDMWLHIVDNCD